MNDEEFKKEFKSLQGKVDRILTFLEGDEKLGTPSVSKKMESHSRQISQVRTRTFENEENIKFLRKDFKTGKEELERDIKTNKDDVKNIKKAAGIVGGGTGGIIWLLIEALKNMVR